jgi:hypothetical protein
MPADATNRLEDVLLTHDDVGEIFALYELSRTSTSYGFLAIRNEDDYRVLFEHAERVVATGVRDNGRLIAHSICHRLMRNPYEQNAILSSIDASRERMFHGDGTSVHPDYQGRRLAQRLFKLRQREIETNRIEHMVGLVAVDNLVSIGNVLHAGALLVGFVRDETAMNYLVYAGRLQANLTMGSPPLEVDWQDHETHASLFERRHAVCGLARAVAEGEGRKFHFLPMR